jgi:hypothetical protein
MTRILTFSIFLFWNIQAVCAQKIEPIDSVYLNKLPDFLKKAESIKDEVWPGMKIGPFCIYRTNGPVFLMNHPKPPANATYLGNNIYMLNQADLALMGTTQTEINHYLTAQNHYDQSFYVSETQFYSELFHELHHVYQRNYIKNIQFDNPADILTYPEDYRNDAIKQYENELLLEMLLGPSSQFENNLNKFYSCRVLRGKIISDKYLDYEKRVESLEGPATYCEYMYMKKFSSGEKELKYINKRFFYSLVEPAYGREGLRNKNLLSGMIQCLLLSGKFKNWQKEYYASGLMLNDYFFSKFKPSQVKLPNLSVYEAKSRYFTNVEKEKHEQHFQAFNSQGGLKITLLFKSFPEFKSFDPMHAEAINDSLILHSTSLKLVKDSNDYFNMTNQAVVTLINNQVWFVKSVTLYVPQNAIRINGKILACKTDNVNINWRFLNLEKKENEYVVILE